MKEFLKIALNLFIISLVAAGLLGAVFTRTETIRKRNEAARLEASMSRYVRSPDGVVRYLRIHRLLVNRPGQPPALGYLFPVRDGGEAVLVLDAAGAVLAKGRAEGPLDDEAARERAVDRVLPGAASRGADTYILAEDGSGRRLASFIEGRTPGFKTWIHLLVALAPDDSILGLEILSHEEDPGLGAEVEQEYFREQFTGRSLAELNSLGVVKLPLPEDYRLGLERSQWAARGITPEQGRTMLAAHKGEPIHAITGATISSRRITDGLKRLVQAFVKRMAIVRAAAGQAGLEPAF